MTNLRVRTTTRLLCGLAILSAALVSGCAPEAMGDGAADEPTASSRREIYLAALETADPTKHTVLTFNLHAPGFNRVGLNCTELYDKDNQPTCKSEACLLGHYDGCYCLAEYGEPFFESCKAASADYRIREMAKVIAASGADVVVLQEVDKFTEASSVGTSMPRDMTQEIEEALEALTEQPWYNWHHQACSEAGPAPYLTARYGDAMLSTTPFVLRDITLNGDDQDACIGGFPYDVGCLNPETQVQQMQAIYADVRGTRIFGVHLTPTGNTACAQLRDAQLARLAPYLTTGPMVIAGDFNEDKPVLARNFPKPDYFWASSPVTHTHATPGCPRGGDEALDHIVTRHQTPSQQADTQALAFGDYRASDHRAVAISTPQEWDTIVPLRLGWSLQNAFFFYSARGAPGQQGRGEVYGTGQPDVAKLSFKSHYDHYRSTWDIIVAGDFDNDGAEDDLLFYDRAAGRGEFHSINENGLLSHIRTYTNWRTSWDLITPVRIGSNEQGLVFYDARHGRRGRGTVEIHRVNDTSVAGTQAASMSAVYSNTSWSANVQNIVPGDFDVGSAKDGLLFYDPVASRGDFYRVRSDGTPLLLRSMTSWRNTWDEIVPVALPGLLDTGLLFHDRTGSDEGQSLTQLYRTDTFSSLEAVNWSRTWFSIAAQELTTDGFSGQELFFYDRTMNTWEMYGISSDFDLIDVTPENPWRMDWGTKLTGTARMSNQYGNYYAHYALDNNVATMAHTPSEVSPWWELNLSTMHYVTRVRVQQRGGCCRGRLSNFQVQWTTRLDGNGQCDFSGLYPTISHTGDFAHRAWRGFSVGDNAKCVRIRSMLTDYLNLPEVQVWGRPATDPDT